MLSAGFQNSSQKKKFVFHLLNYSIPVLRVFETVPVKPETASRWLRAGSVGGGAVTLPRAQAAAAAWIVSEF
jgi:hypothetical protein